MNEPEKSIQEKQQQTIEALLMFHDKLDYLKEKMDCLLYVLCKIHGKDIHESIREYLVYNE